MKPEEKLKLIVKLATIEQDAEMIEVLQEALDDLQASIPLHHEQADQWPSEWYNALRQADPSLWPHGKYIQYRPDGPIYFIGPSDQP